MSEEIKALCVEPGKAPVVTVLGNDLRSLQKAVGGRIELVTIADDACVLCNEEGKLIGLEGNRRLGNDILTGTFYVVGFRGDEFVSLTDSQTQKYAQRFTEPESFTPEEIRDTMNITFFVL